MDIKDARKQIDTIDAQLVNLFEQRLSDPIQGIAD